MIRVVFRHRNTVEESRHYDKDYYLGNGWQWFHCFIVLPTDETIHRDFRGVEYDGKNIYQQYGFSDSKYHVFELPISAKALKTKRQQIKTTPLKFKEWVNFWETGIHAPSYLLQGFTCATIVAWCLGYDDYYKLSVDDIYQRLLTEYPDMLLGYN